MTAVVLLTACAVAPGVRVMRVIDADTLRVTVKSCPAKVRLMGVVGPRRYLGVGRSGIHDGPPMGLVKAWEDRARRFAARLSAGRVVEVLADDKSVKRDKGGRLMVYVMLPDGRILNELIIRAGYGLAGNDYAYRSRLRYLQIEAEARKAGRGLWDDPRFRSFATGQGR